MRGGKEWPFSGVTKSGRVWRKVPESDARSVMNTPKAVSLATSAIGRYGVQTEVNRTSRSPFIITNVLST